MLTEEEAKTKWCFHFIASHTNPRERGALRVKSGDEVSPSTPIPPFAHACIGSACMAWRATSVNELTEVVFAGTREGKPGTGFCGLAGKP